MLNSIYNLKLCYIGLLNLMEIENRVIIKIPKLKSKVILFESYSA